MSWAMMCDDLSPSACSGGSTHILVPIGEHSSSSSSRGLARRDSVGAKGSGFSNSSCCSFDST